MASTSTDTAIELTEVSSDARADHATEKPDSKNSPCSDFMRRSFFQCGALSYKNALLLQRSWKSSLIILLAPAIIVIVMGIVATYENRAVDAGTRNPVVFASLDGTDSSTGYPRCKIFDNIGGEFGYGLEIPKAKCTTIMFAPSANAEATKIMQKLTSTNPGLSTVKLDLTSSSTVDEVISHDVVGMATVKDLELWLGEYSHLGWVSSSIVFNTTTRDGNRDYQSVSTLPPKVRYSLRYNESALSMYTSSSSDPAFTNTDGTTNAMILRMQRSLEESIVSVRAVTTGGSTSDLGNWLKLKLQKFPNYPSQNRGGGSIVSFAVLFFYIGSMITFMLAIVNIVNEKERGLLGSMRTVGLVEIVYWLTWLLYYFVLTTLSTLLLQLIGSFFGNNLPFFSGTEFRLMFHVFFTFQMTMVMNAFMFAALLPRFTPAISVAGTFFFLGLVAQLIFALGGSMLTVFMLDPSIGARPVMLYPPIAFAAALSKIIEFTMPSWKTQPDGETIRIYPTFTYDQFIGKGGRYAKGNEYMTVNSTMMVCESKTPEIDCIWQSESSTLLSFSSFSSFFFLPSFFFLLLPSSSLDSIQTNRTPSSTFFSPSSSPPSPPSLLLLHRRQSCRYF